MSRRHDYDYDRRSYHGGQHQGPHRSHREGGTGWGWLLLLVLLAGGGAGLANANGGSGTGHTPSHKSTVCTQYFKGGC